MGITADDVKAWSGVLAAIVTALSALYQYFLVRRKEWKFEKERQRFAAVSIINLQVNLDAVHYKVDRWGESLNARAIRPSCPCSQDHKTIRPSYPDPTCRRPGMQSLGLWVKRWVEKQNGPRWPVRHQCL